MALIVENGTGLADAESYVSVADADTYFSKRGNAAWAALATAVKEESLRKATDYMVETYRLRWKGSRVNGVQALDWPRAFVLRADFQYAGMNGQTMIGGESFYPSDVVPVEVANACAELAFRASSADLLADYGSQVKSETVGPISVTYADGARQTVRYAAIDRKLSPFLIGWGQMQVARA